MEIHSHFIIFIALAGGIFLPTGGGLACPYNHALDFGALLTSQEKEDITFGAQKAVRVVMFHGMERLLFWNNWMFLLNQCVDTIL